jgi:plasmid stabilization system protein ParE
MIITYEPAARDEIRSALDYITSESGLAAAGAFLTDLLAAERLIGDFPNAHPRTFAGCRRILCAHFPYQLVYRIEAAEIVIYAVAHLKRRPGYWKKRLQP